MIPILSPRFLSAPLAILVILALPAQSNAAEAAAVKILRDNCVSCHGGPTPVRYLDLSNREGALRGGVLGPAIIPGNVLESLVYRTVVREPNVPQMPKDKPKLSDADIKVLKNWIEDGAPWEEPADSKESKDSK
jgi:hypothetical protein